jgi:REP-associated tyrosine transposase
MSYTCLNYHIVYSTKGRGRLLSEDEMTKLCEYIAGIIRNQKNKLYIANGPSDHIHLAVSLHPEISLVDFVRTIKTNSSRWIHQRFSDLSDFAWQDGYSAFSVSHSGLEKVIEYIRNQKEHHKNMTFQEELVIFLKKHNIEYDERYISG